MNSSKNPAGDREWIVEAHDGNILDIVHLPNYRAVLTAGIDGTIKRWNVADGTLSASFTGHERGVTSITPIPSFDEFVSGSMDASIGHWVLTNDTQGDRYHGHDESVEDLAVTPDGQYFVSGSYDSRLLIWRFGYHEPQHVIENHRRNVVAVDVSPSGELVASGGVGGTVLLHDIRTGKCVRELSVRAEAVVDLAFLPDSGALLITGKDGEVELWKPDLRKRVFHRRLAEPGELPIATIPGSEVAFVGVEQGIVAIDLGDGTVRSRVSLPIDYLFSLAVAPTRLAAAGSHKGDLYLRSLP